jgi:hypothetical protein
VKKASLSAIAVENKSSNLTDGSGLFGWKFNGNVE